jgi:hypothetical protein
MLGEVQFRFEKMVDMVMYNKSKYIGKINNNNNNNNNTVLLLHNADHTVNKSRDS